MDSHHQEEFQKWGSNQENALRTNAAIHTTQTSHIPTSKPAEQNQQADHCDQKKKMAEDLTETKIDDNDTHSNADSISDLPWEFGKPEPAEIETTIVVDIEGDTTQNEENPDTEPDRANDKKPKKAIPKSARAKTKMDCIKIRCRVALVTGNEVGTVTAGEHKKSCQRCKNFDKELAALEKIESMLPAMHTT